MSAKTYGPFLLLLVPHLKNMPNVRKWCIMRAMRKKQQQTLAAILPGLARDKGWTRNLDMYSLFLHWQDFVDETTSDHARPLKIVRDVLWVEVDNSAWIHQLQFQKLSILESINHSLKLTTIADLKFVLLKEDQQPKKETKKPTFVPPPAEEQQAFRRQISGIKDEESREALMKLWYLSKSVKKAE